MDVGEIKRGKEIGKHGRDMKFIYAACEECGKERWVVLAGGKPKNKRCHRCANSQGETNSPNWRGGRTVTGQGYIEIKLYPGDFFSPMADKTGYVLEHRLIMAKHVKRCLLPWEVVHHRNGVRNDNRIENLELLPCKGKHNTQINKRIKELERTVSEQAIEIKLLKWQIKELIGGSIKNESIDVSTRGNNGWNNLSYLWIFNTQRYNGNITKFIGGKCIVKGG